MTRFALVSVVLAMLPAFVACHGGRCCPPPCDPVVAAPHETLVMAQGNRYEAVEVPALESENTETLWAGLIQGNMRFREGHSQNPRRDASRRAATATSQSPRVVVLACADSRVAPEVLFDQGIGDLFVVRVAGNMSTPEVDTSIEYAVEHLGARLIVVLGHERCGAVTAAIAGGDAPGHLPALLARIRPAVDATSSDEPKAARLEHAIAINARLNAESLAANEILKEAAHKHGVAVRAAVYDLDTGAVTEVPMRPAGEPAAHH